jgi:hypothetical protein
MQDYVCEGTTAATAATAENAIAQVWNPSAVKPIWINELHVVKTTAGAGDMPYLRRTSARGTVTVSTAADITHHFDHELAPVSGFTLDTTFSAQPTFLGTAQKGLMSALIAAAIGSAWIWVFRQPIRVKPGQGLCITTKTALAFPASLVTALVSE